MTERRPFPPSPRRLALARQAGLTAASPIVVGALACVAAVLALVVLGRAAATTIGAWIAAACDGRAPLDASAITPAVLELAAPLIGAAAIAAIVAHVVQTRALWSPRRRIEGAPQLDRGTAQRTARTGFELAAAGVIGVVAFGWLWTIAPRIAGLFALPATSLLATAAALIASLVIAIAIAWVVIGTIDALMRHAELARALAMTAVEKRQDDRLAAADPRWSARRAALGRGPQIGDAIAGASLVILGDDLAVAIAWDPSRQPIPVRVATGRRARATQIIGLARRSRMAIHRDRELALALSDGDGPVPERHWSRLAEIVAAVRGGGSSGQA